MSDKRRLITPEIDNLIDKALVVLDDAQKRIDSAKLHGVGVNIKHDIDLNKNKKELMDLKKSEQRAAGKRAYIYESKIAFLKEASNKTYYDNFIEYLLSYSTPQSRKSMKTGKMVTDYVRGNKWVTQKEINAIRRKEQSGTASDTEVQLLANWQEATKTASDAINVTTLPKVDKGVEATDEQRAQMIRARRNRHSLDLSIGGQSTLINDLSYFLGSKFKAEVIRSFIDWLRKGMQDKKFFAEVETLYHRNGKLQRDIDDAKGANWYKQYKIIISALAELMQQLEDHYGDRLDFKEEFDNLHDAVETKAMEGI